MFTSLRSRLWLSYAFVIVIALSIVAIVLLVFLIRNPVLSRQTQQQLVAVKDLILEPPQRFIRNQSLLQDVSQTSSIRVLVFNANREMVSDTNPEKPQIQYPGRNLLNRGSQTAGVHIQADAPNDFPVITSDGDRLTQVFTNLVDNALKFTPANGEITLSARKTGAGMEFFVTDTGSGIPNEALPHLFDRFYQADPSRAGGEKHGSGLGLA